MLVDAGDILLCKAPNNWFTAVRVISVDHSENMTLIYPAAYIAETPPDIDDPLLYKICRENDIYVTWVDGIVSPKGFQKLMNVPLKEWEIKQINRRNSYSPSWLGFSNPAYYAWLEKNDPELYDKLVYGVSDENPQPAIIKSLHATKFWNIIKLIDLDDEENGIEAAIERLASYSEEDIKAFEEALSQRLYKLDTKLHAEQIGDNAYQNDETYFSPDYFLYARCYVVAKGKEFYNEVVKKPKNMPKNKEFEPLLELASTAYERKTGEDTEFISSVDYETFSNEEGWL
ncbi:DUF4240 domain-containing protein [Peribacillus sp. JNUCC 23]